MVKYSHMITAKQKQLISTVRVCQRGKAPNPNSALVCLCKRGPQRQRQLGNALGSSFKVKCGHLTDPLVFPLFLKKKKSLNCLKLQSTVSHM